MKHIVLKGHYMSTKDITHTYLRYQFAFPYSYGANLDALYDCLTDISEPTRISLFHIGLIKENLGAYGDTLIKTFEDAVAANPNLTFFKL